ncbi:MAG: hypothetical protein F4Y78_01075 [Candidatus Dadabacteria bacterium]|nr:hypothetical protein [Candidatus Dadabacteria bacterium]MYA48458.1 hypothetical protein [Candidatus Dadabacteria bacterium]MYG82968.1 hypothetical protein [Candidatus Dadabacteria bacterium]MYK49940.1 hypothetical protein [Candidatus Dadabacteria bacterium]
MTETMFQRLSRYYQDNGILSTSFTCPHKEECSGDSPKFTGPKSAFVSTGYENRSPNLPRLLFLSLDSGDGDKDDRNRLPGALRQQEEIERDVLALPNHKHWYRTHELAWYIFKRFNPDIRLEDAKGHFAHANSAKCCMNKPGRKQADRVLFRNCRKYLKGELEILCPDVIVTQGAEAKKAVVSFYKPPERIGEDEYASTILMNSRKVFWLHTYHPGNWGAFNRQRNFDKTRNLALGWDKYSHMIHEFIEADNKEVSLL